MASSEAAGRAQALIEQFAKASGWLNRSELRDLECCAEVGKDVLRAGIRSLVAVADGSPMMRSTSADGTTIDAKKQQKCQMPMSDQEFSRSGRETHEYLIMNGFYRYVDHSGAVHTRAHVDEPTPLMVGKTAEHIWEACRHSFCSLREAGHLGPALEHYCFDSAVHSALTTLFVAWHKVCAKQRHNEDSGNEDGNLNDDGDASAVTFQDHAVVLAVVVEVLIILITYYKGSGSSGNNSSSSGSISNI